MATVSARYSRHLHRAMKIAGAETGRSIQGILDEAITDWLIKQGKEVPTCDPTPPLQGQTELPL